MEDDSLSMGLALSRWQHLTDDYATAVAALQRGDPAVHASLARIAQAMHSSAAPGPLVGSNPKPSIAADGGAIGDGPSQLTGPEKTVRSALHK